MAQRVGQSGLEALRQAGDIHVEALQVGVEVFARAVHPLADGFGVLRADAGEFGEVGEDVDELDLLGEWRPVGLGHCIAGLEVVVE